jgi:hypothetical protein
MSTTKKIIISLFEETDKADIAYKTVLELGYTEEEINVILSDKKLDEIKKDNRYENISTKAMMPVGKKLAIGISTSGDQKAINSPSSIFPGGVSRILSEWGFTGSSISAIEEKINTGAILLAAIPRKADDIPAIEEAWSVHSGQLFTTDMVTGLTGLQTQQGVKSL